MIIGNKVYFISIAITATTCFSRAVLTIYLAVDLANIAAVATVAAFISFSSWAIERGTVAVVILFDDDIGRAVAVLRWFKASIYEIGRVRE